jgi:endo-1,3(4)-beta-glucanase
MLQMLHGAQTEALIVRAAVVIPSPDVESYSSFLRTYSNVFPGEGTSVGYEFGTDQAALVFDWDPQVSREDTGNQDLIMFAMPHHQDRLSTVTDHCASVLLGSVCLIVGSQWNIVETLPPISFRAPRGPDASMLPALMDAVANDLTYRVPENYMRGAGDTYFSGKAMAKLARILLITGEILEICEQRRLLRGLQSTVACGDGVLPDRATLEEGIAHLKAAVDIWLSQDAEAPFVFDNAWGGIVSCGCDYSGGFCQNEYPNCPGLSDQGLNFGAGFYNDHHFHYGYHIYAAATIAHFDPEWGRDNFEAVLLLVRDIANPSLDDPFFPQARHKDWFHGSSWASGISLPVSPTGMNQESSSEAIAGYEAVALFGKTMASIFTDETSKAAATDIYQFGRLLAATELRSTKRYWQVSREDSIIEDPYQHNVVGILWSSKLFFGTWFGNYPYFIYGIQLMPLTPISEERDELDWIREAFDPYASACDGRCVAEGWSVQILALLATLGHKEKAMGHAQDLGASTFESAGGSGHSLSNTLWYIATRPPTDEPITLDQTYAWEAGPLNVTCLQPETCTAAVLDSLAGDSTCRSRIAYLVNTLSKSEYEACYQVAVTEYPGICGACTPESGSSTTAAAETSAPSTLTCNKPNTCTADVLGASAGGFSCGDRIEYIMARGMSEVEACRTVAAYEFPSVCGGCDPD